MNKNTTIIQVSEEAATEIKKLSMSKDDNQPKILIRIGVKQGGCSGLAYFMELTNFNQISTSDEIIDYDDFSLICDNKSLLYLYGMLLNYDKSMIGGGFKFSNPNALQTCGCGKSFNL
uniref:Cyanobacterial iron-binding protein n=1 Tax=Rhodochaete parvula TaxID=110510 RepID=A0A1X9PUQ4_9RHOD|nr:hypothetical protein [Rhodochaete parvula]ASK39683.1 cyanobacterial iron-binding protein [Rhodochaete parvula]